MIRIDLHTHSEASPDGGITPDEYAEILKNETVDVVAITDHDRIDFARGMQKALGEKYIIVGEEITTIDGEIIGLYLSEAIQPGLSAAATIQKIHEQGGLVYIPHPFEKIRKGIKKDTLNLILNDVDIIETNNGRALTRKHAVAAQTIAVKNKIPGCASSDAHGVAGVGHTYTTISERPTKETLLSLLSEATFAHSKPPLKTRFYPKKNRFMKKIKGQI